MTYPIWPIQTRDNANEPTPQVITHDSDADHHLGNLGCDVAGWLHDLWVVVAHKGAIPTVVGVWYQSMLGPAGYAAEIQWPHPVFGNVNFRYCHGHDNMEIRWPWVRTGIPMEVGWQFGEVGVSGDTTGPHLHLACSVGAPDGQLLERGWRFKADTMLRDIIESHMEDTMNEAQKAENRRIADIIDSWALNHENRAALAQSIGYGIDDSYSTRVAGDFRGLAQQLREVETL